MYIKHEYMLCNDVHSSVVIKDINLEILHIIYQYVYNIRVKFHVCILNDNVIRDVLRRRVLRKPTVLTPLCAALWGDCSDSCGHRQQEISAVFTGLYNSAVLQDISTKI